MSGLAGWGVGTVWVLQEGERGADVASSHQPGLDKFGGPGPSRRATPEVSPPTVIGARGLQPTFVWNYRQNEGEGTSALSLEVKKARFPQRGFCPKLLPALSANGAAAMGPQRWLRSRLSMAPHEAQSGRQFFEGPRWCRVLQVP